MDGFKVLATAVPPSSSDLSAEKAVPAKAAEDLGHIQACLLPHILRVCWCDVRNNGEERCILLGVQVIHPLIL